MPSFFRIPKLQLVILLSLIAICSLLNFLDISNLYLIILAVSSNVFFDLFFTYLKKRVLFMPFSAIITGLIMGLIINQSAGLFQILTASLISMGLKNFLRIQGRHIFNPVASGLFISSILFSEYIGWWGVSFQKINGLDLKNLIFFLVLLSPILISAIRLKKYYLILTYLILNTLLSVILFPGFDNFLTNILIIIVTPSTLFFALVMLPEPMTSPVNYKNQILYGAVVAIIPTLFSFSFINQISQTIAFDPLLFALLFGNLIFFKNR